MNIPEKDFGIEQDQLFHIWTAGVLFGLMRSHLPLPESPDYDAEFEEYERSYLLLLDVNAFREEIGINARNYSREDNEVLSVLYGARLAKSFV